MTYTINRTFAGAQIDDIDSRARKALAEHGFGGAMLPCNVVLREVEGVVEVSAIDPVASMRAIENAELTAVAGEVRDRLAKAVAAD